MYGLGRTMTERGAHIVARQAEKMEQRIQARAERFYPNLPAVDAREAYERRRAAGAETRETLEQNWPIIGAIVGGLLIFTFFKR